jgi:chromosome segregation ATPase
MPDVISSGMGAGAGGFKGSGAADLTSQALGNQQDLKQTKDLRSSIAQARKQIDEDNKNLKQLNNQLQNETDKAKRDIIKENIANIRSQLNQNHAYINDLTQKQAGSAKGGGGVGSYTSDMNTAFNSNLGGSGGGGGAATTVKSDGL